MAFWESVKELEGDKFRRLTGVEIRTFERMAEILREAERVKKARGGKPSKLGIEDRLLMAPEYIREYRTYFHIAESYGVSESACYRNVRWIEDTLIKEGTFSLPGRKELLKSDVEYEVVMVDATETPIERPKKNSGAITRGKRSDIP